MSSGQAEISGRLSERMSERSRLGSLLGIQVLSTGSYVPAEIVSNRYVNTSAASIPLALDEARRSGRIDRGDRVLMCGFGAGLAWGTAILEW